MRPLALAAWLLALAVSARAADIFKDAKAVGDDITVRHQALAQQNAQAAATPAPSTADDVKTVQDADIKVYELFEAGWLPAELSQLAAAIRAGSKAVLQLHQAHPSAVADAYHNGTMTNIEDSFKLFGGGNLERGCISHQSATLSALRGAGLDKLEIKPIMVGKGMEHHAVIVYPKAQPDWKKSGVVLDGWRYQTHEPKQMTFTFSQWNKVFWSLPYPRLETD